MLARACCIAFLGISFAASSARAEDSAPSPSLLGAAIEALLSFEQLCLAQLEGHLIHLYRERAEMDQQLPSWSIKSQADRPQRLEGETLSPDAAKRYADNSIAAWERSGQIDRDIDKTLHEIQDIEIEIKTEMEDLRTSGASPSKS